MKKAILNILIVLASTIQIPVASVVELLQEADIDNNKYLSVAEILKKAKVME